MRLTAESVHSTGIARDIIDAHGGTLTVEDLPQGAAMRIRLPLPDETDEGSGTVVTAASPLRRVTAARMGTASAD